MAVDWAQAWEIGGVGFGLVLAVLVILALTMWLTGILLRKIGAGRGEAGDKDRGD